MGLCLKINEQIFNSKNFGKANILKYGYLDYIQGDGASYIDTGFDGYRNNYRDVSSNIPSDTPKIEVVFQKSSELSEYIIASKDGGGNLSILADISNIQLTGKGATGRFQFSNYSEDVNVIYGSVKSFINGQVVKDNTDMSNQYRLNAFPNNNITLLGGKINASKTVFSKNKIKSFKAYKGDKLVLHLRPYRKEDGTVCMIDELTKNFYYNSGTGQFIGI